MTACRLIVIGASWGGLHAVGEILAGLPADFRPTVLVVQHRAEDSDDLLAGLLDRRGPLSVREVEDKDPLSRRGRAGRPGGLPRARRARPLRALHGGGGALQPARRSTSTLETAADALGPELVGVVLTGANDDGAVRPGRGAPRAAGSRSSRTRRRRWWPTMPAAAAPRPAPGRGRARRRSRALLVRLDRRGRVAMRDDDQPAVLLVDDREENLIALRAVLEPLPCRLVSVDLGQGGAEGAAARGLRGRAARRADAEHGRLRDGRADQGARAHAHAADHLRHRDQQGARPRLPRLRDRRGRLRLQAVRPGRSCARRSAVFLELDAKSRAAARSEAILRAAFDDAPIGMARLDLEGRIDEANRALAELLGQRPADLRDRLFDDFVHRERRCGWRRRRSGEAFEHEARLLVAARRARPVPAERLARAAGRRRCPT